MADDADDFSAWFDDAIAEIAAAQQSKRIKLENPWALDILKILFTRGTKGLRRVEVIDRIELMRKSHGLPIPKAFSETVQSAFQKYCVHSEVFKKSGASIEDGIFLWPKGKGAGIWAVDVEKAKAWIAARQKQL